MNKNRSGDETALLGYGRTHIDDGIVAYRQNDMWSRLGGGIDIARPRSISDSSCRFFGLLRVSSTNRDYSAAASGVQHAKRGSNALSSGSLDLRRAWQAWIELGLSIYTLITAGIMIEAGQWLTAGVLLIYAIGFALVGGGSLQTQRVTRTRPAPRSVQDEALS